MVEGEVVHSAKTEATNLKMSSTLTIGNSTTRVKIPVVASSNSSSTTASLAGKKRARANTRTQNAVSSTCLSKTGKRGESSGTGNLPLLMNKSDDECDDDELIDKLE